MGSDGPRRSLSCSRAVPLERYGPPSPGTPLSAMAQITELASTQDADRMIQASYERPVYLFKHSIACPVSARGQMAFVELAEEGDVDAYVVVVQYARAVSTYIAEALGVRHETPQALLIKDGEAVSVANHSAVRTDALRQAHHAAA